MSSFIKIVNRVDTLNFSWYYQHYVIGLLSGSSVFLLIRAVLWLLVKVKLSISLIFVTLHFPLFPLVATSQMICPLLHISMTSFLKLIKEPTWSCVNLSREIPVCLFVPLWRTFDDYYLSTTVLFKWSSYVAPMTPKWGSQTQNGRFRCKIALRLKNSVAVLGRGYEGKEIENRRFRSNAVSLGTTPSTWNFGSKWPRWSAIADFRSLFCSLRFRHNT